MDKHQKNVYQNQPQPSVNYNMLNPLHLPQPHQQHTQAQPQHFYQSPIAPQIQQPIYYAASAPTYPTHHVPIPQHFSYAMGPPPPYSNTAPAYSPGYVAQPIFHSIPTAAPPQTAGYTTALFDSGARFNGKAPSIPPPPPGYIPSPAQIAVMQGQTVVVDKKKNNFFTGGKGAGYTFW